MIGSVLQALGLLVGSVSVGFVFVPAGGLLFAVGLVVFGLSFERSGDV